MKGLLNSTPGGGDLPDYYLGYVERLGPVSDILVALEEHGHALVQALADLAPEQETHRYAEGKWSVREVVGHLMDTERVFQLRALWFARADPQPLPGFDENAWAGASHAGEQSMGELLEEYVALRRSTVSMFRNLAEEELDRTGVANGRSFRVAALPWFLLGHEHHHREILRDRYGV